MTKYYVRRDAKAMMVKINGSFHRVIGFIDSEFGAVPVLDIKLVDEPKGTKGYNVSREDWQRMEAGEPYTIERDKDENGNVIKTRVIFAS